MALNPFIPQMFPENLLCVICLPGTLRTLSNFILCIALEIDFFLISQIDKYDYRDEVSGS